MVLGSVLAKFHTHFEQPQRSAVFEGRTLELFVLADYVELAIICDDLVYYMTLVLYSIHFLSRLESFKDGLNLCSCKLKLWIS